MEKYGPLAKRCCDCNQYRPIELFSRNRRVPSGLNARCKPCAKIYKDAWNKRRAEHIKQYYLNHKADPIWKERTRNKRLIKYHGDKAYREALTEKNRLRRRLEPAKIAQRANERKRRLERPTYRIRRVLSVRLRDALNNPTKYKSASIVELIGCSLADFVRHLESTWQPGMSWENYGRKGWHIDHIIPVCTFDLTKPEEQKRCYNYSNTQALWAIDNLRKGNKYLK